MGELNTYDFEPGQSQPSQLPVANRLRCSAVQTKTRTKDPCDAAIRGNEKVATQF